MDEELRREREREREADREREKEREREREKELERERERERELERQREQRAREKELLAAKALEPAFLPVAELHALRGHAEERIKPSEQLTPTRAGTWLGPVLGEGGLPAAGSPRRADWVAAASLRGAKVTVWQASSWQGAGRTCAAVPARRTGCAWPWEFAH